MTKTKDRMRRHGEEMIVVHSNMVGMEVGSRERKVEFHVHRDGTLNDNRCRTTDLC